MSWLPYRWRAQQSAITNVTRINVNHRVLERNAPVCNYQVCLIEWQFIIIWFPFRPQFKQDHAPNLSILLSAGKENNSDSPSSGERNGKSPKPNLLWGNPWAKCGLQNALSEPIESKLLGKACHRRWQPCKVHEGRSTSVFLRVALLESVVPIGR